METDTSSMRAHLVFGTVGLMVACVVVLIFSSNIISLVLSFPSDVWAIVFFTLFFFVVPVVTLTQGLRKSIKIIRMFLEQSAVDQYLMGEATIFQVMCMEEAELLKKNAQASTDDSALSDRISDCREALYRAKTRFWRAHKLAKFAGFTVHESVKDYWPKKEPENI